MLDLKDIASRVDRGLATPTDTAALFAEVSRLYGQPVLPSVIALEAAQQADEAARAASERAAASVLAAQEEAAAAADRAATAKAVAEAAQQAADERQAQEKALADAAVAQRILAEQQATADSLKTQLAPAEGA